MRRWELEEGWSNNPAEPYASTTKPLVRNGGRAELALAPPSPTCPYLGTCPGQVTTVGDSGKLSPFEP